MSGATPSCYLCRSPDRVGLLGTASIPMPPSNPLTSVNYLDAALVSLGLRPVPEDRKPSLIYTCRRCDLIWRAANLADPGVISRLDRMVTVLPEHEQVWSDWRAGFFHHEFVRLKRLLGQDARGPVAYLDVGCSYGHLLDIAHQNGWHVAGVDASKTLIQWLAPRKSYPLFPVVLPQEPLPFPDNSFDLITFYDSFYMLEDPLSVLSEVYAKLKPGGYLVVRLANRNRYVKLWLLLQKFLGRLRRGHHPIDAIAIFGDQKYSYSPKSFAQLLNRSNFRGARVRSRLLERGKKRVLWVTRLVYFAGLLISWALLKKVVLTPSFTAVVQKEPRS